jgi:putative endonuclease
VALHIELGKDGESQAADWLMKNGYEILYRNWRYSRCEIDIIATKNGTVHIVEVKTRRYSRFIRPEESVSRKKFKHIQKVCDHFLHMHPGHRWIQFDILSITMFDHKETEYFMLEDVAF